MTTNQHIASKPKILLLGGITEAYELEEKLSHLPLHVITSLAGRTRQPRLPKGDIRIGGFGGIDGLTQYCQRKNINFIIDATHPFAIDMTKNAYASAQITRIPLIRFERAIWQKKAGDNWIEVETLETAALKLSLYKTIFLALGRQHLEPFLKLNHYNFIARMIEPPSKQAKNIKLIFSKPGTKEEEKKFLLDNHIDVIICRNSGGDRSYTKIEAARELKLPIIMITRTLLPHLFTLENQDDIIKSICETFNIHYTN